MLVDSEPGDTNAELRTKRTQWDIVVRGELRPGPPFALAQTSGDGARNKDTRLPERGSDVAESKRPVDGDRLIQAIVFEDRESTGGAEDTGEFNDGFVRQRRTATKDNMGGIVTAKELLCFWRQIALPHKVRVPQMVLGKPFSEGLRRVLSFKCMRYDVRHETSPGTSAARGVLTRLPWKASLTQCATFPQ